MAARTRRAQFDLLAMLDAMSPGGDARRAAQAAANALEGLAAMDSGALALAAGDVVVARQLDRAAAALEVLRHRVTQAAGSAPGDSAPALPASR